MILVVGATGAQGGSVARRLLADGKPVRLLSRHTSSPAARALASRGAEVAEGDLADTGSLVRALRGCQGVFGMTSFCEHFGTELTHGKNLVDAALEARVEHLVLSTLPSSISLSSGALSVAHYESKAEIERYARAVRAPASFVHASFYFENFLSTFLKRAPDGNGLAFGFPQGNQPLASFGVEDFGAVVALVFEQRSRFMGEVVPVVAEYLRAEEYAAIITRVTGRDVRYSHVPESAYAALPIPNAALIAASFELTRRYAPFEMKHRAATRALHPAILGFESWVQERLARFQAFE
jgi:uncharacterized protein YbjT (DUF2867 family)